MPDIRNCRRCGKIYNYIGGAPLCPVCRDKDEEDFRRVKEYLYKNPGASMSDVSTELEISVEKITRFLKDGRLEIVSEGGNLVLECEKCGKSVRSGRFCDECSRSIAQDIDYTAKEMSRSDEPTQQYQRRDVAMRYLSREHKNEK